MSRENFWSSVYKCRTVMYYIPISKERHDHKEPEMPVLTTIPVPATQLKLGDVVTLLSEGIKDAPVVGRDSKYKYTYLELQVNEGMSIDYRLPNETVFDVQRAVPTEEETAAEQLKHTLLALDHKERIARQALAAAREKMRTDMEAGVSASHWNWMAVPEAEALVHLWDKIAHVSRARAQRAWYEPEAGVKALSRVEVVRMVIQAEERQALSHYRALSRSTSVVSNLFDDIRIAALSKLRSDMDWILLED